MGIRRVGTPFECVLMDLNTQHDFLLEDGMCRVANADQLVPTLKSVSNWAVGNHVPVISSVDSHRPEEGSRNGLPIHCLDGSSGQRKLGFTLLPNRVCVEGDNMLSVPLNLFHRHQQVIFRKRTPDLFGNPKADRFLTQLGVSEYILFGVGLELSVKSLALGLMARGRRVSVLSDACGYWNPAAADFTLRLLAAKGATLLTVNELLARRYCSNPGDGDFEPEAEAANSSDWAAAPDKVARATRSAVGQKRGRNGKVS